MSDNIRAYKTALRSTVKTELAELSEDYLRASNLAITEAMLKLPELNTASSIFIYYSTGREVDTLAFARDALAAGKKLLLPISLPGGVMKIADFTGFEALTADRYGIPAPHEEKITDSVPDAVIVPALCFDEHGYRLGHGGGYYDRWLAEYTGFKLGLCREKLLKQDVPRDSFDERVDAVLTEKRLLRF